MARIIKQDELLIGSNLDDLIYFPEDNVKKEERQADLHTEDNDK